MVIGLVVVLALIMLAGIAVYNRLVRLYNRTENAWSQVDVQLQRRYSLVPNLLETVKGYASHERDTLESVTAARTAAQEAGTIAEQGAAEDVLTGALRRLFALAEAYPQLGASDNFRELQQELGETEDRIAIARQIYNDSVLTYNNAVETVPSNIVARLTGYAPEGYFELDGDARSAPEVRF